MEQAKEHQREARMFRWLAGSPMDLKLDGRMLVKCSGLTIVGGVATAFAIWVGIVILDPPRLPRVRQSGRSLTDVGAWRDSSRNLIVSAGDPRPVNVAEMSVSGFRVADGEPLMGRVLVEADEQPAVAAGLKWERPNVALRGRRHGSTEVAPPQSIRSRFHRTRRTLRLT